MIPSFYAIDPILTHCDAEGSGCHLQGDRLASCGREEILPGNGKGGGSGQEEVRGDQEAACSHAQEVQEGHGEGVAYVHRPCGVQRELSACRREPVNPA